MTTLLDIVGSRTWVSEFLNNSSPDREAVITDSGPVRYGDMIVAIADACTRLTEKYGIVPGDRVALHVADGPWFAALTLAVNAIGAVAAPVAMKLTPTEVAQVIGAVSPALVINESGPGVSQKPGAVREVRKTDIIPEFAPAKKADIEQAYAALRARASMLDIEMPCTIICTSGTTGRPVPIVWSHGNVVFTVSCLRTYYQYGPKDVGWSVFAWAYANGHLNHMITWLSSGMTMVTTPFSSSQYCEQLGRFKPTVMSLNSTHIKMILARLPEGTTRVPNSLRMLKTALGLDKMSQDRFVEIFNVRLFKSYSQTECVTAAVTHMGPNEFRWSINENAIGFPALPYEIRLVDETGNDARPGESGEMLVRCISRHGISLGHIDENGVLVEHDRLGWWRTGDLGIPDGEGYIYYFGRVKDVIKRAGHNVSSAEVENAVLNYPGILDAAVIGEPDQFREEGIVVFAKTAAAELSLETLNEHCAKSLAPYKLPTRLILVDSIPRTEIGKLDKRTLMGILQSSRSQVH